ncbi:P-loop containing nucleoside triphosphate hydrolase protein [Hypoxylon sp. NC1633]|nr:P-loop containing nucleoside triphosphate hydrolase protein [Hypoxylon sp. NC1633]
MFFKNKNTIFLLNDLRKHGIGRFVNLPQIIVVRDQSSGKGSVLEAIFRVRFPVKDGLYTRFATELVLRTDHRTRVDVRIQPSTNSKNRAYSFKDKSFNKDELPRIIEEAKKKMLEGDSGFSEDVLRIEISGPDIPHLTLVDLPGFYHSDDENQSAAGREVVDRLAERYMARKNSIVLAIISARNQVILQKVLSKVKQYDQHKERTLGIITKPDILISGSQDEANFIRLAKNLDRSHELSLGWHVLRNRGETDQSDSDEQRDKKEQDFFETSHWSGVISKNRGVESLRKKLSGILLGHIRNNLQSLIESIEENINDRKAQLARLGEPRSKPKELRTHLDKIASQFHILCLHAVEGNYSDEFFGGLYPGTDLAAINDSRIKKLRALARDFNRAFAHVLETKGIRRIIVPSKIDAVELNLDDSKSNSDDDDDAAAKDIPAFIQPLAKQYMFEDPETVVFEDIASELESLSSANQGNEFPGTSNDRLAVKLFQDQSRPWEAIARRHLELLLRVTQAFVDKLMDHVISPDKKTRSAILPEIVDPFFEKKNEVLESKLQELLHHYKSGHPQPLDREFRSLLARRRRKNLTTNVVQDLFASRPELFTEAARKEFEDTEPSNRGSEFGVEELIDKSETYYDMALRTFTDNVVVLAVENCLIRDLPSIFTTEKMNQMEVDELERLASESPEIQVERQELQAEYDALMKGLHICNRFKERKITSVPSVIVEPPTTNSSKDKEANPAAYTNKTWNGPSIFASLGKSTGLPTSTGLSASTDKGFQSSSSSFAGFGGFGSSSSTAKFGGSDQRKGNGSIFGTSTNNTTIPTPATTFFSGASTPSASRSPSFGGDKYQSQDQFSTSTMPIKVNLPQAPSQCMSPKLRVMSHN